jgi:hypothetical protein
MGVLLGVKNEKNMQGMDRVEVKDVERALAVCMTVCKS